MVSCLGFEIGLTVATRINLRYRGIPDPDRWTFQPYSSVRVSLDGRSKGFGFPAAQWEWDFFDQRTLNLFLSFFDGTTDASVIVHINTITDSGSDAPNMMYTYQAIMHRPVDGQGKTLVSESRTPIYSGIGINFTHLVSE